MESEKGSKGVVRTDGGGRERKREEKMTERHSVDGWREKEEKGEREE